MSPESLPQLTTYQGLAQMVDHELLLPNLTDVQVMDGLQMAKRYGIACVSVRPCDIDMAVRTLAGSPVKAGSVCSFPHGTQNTATKLYETRDLLRRGAKEIDMVVTISKLLSREFQHVQTELSQMAEACHKEGALLKVILETAYLTEELKIIACRCCERAEVDFVIGSGADDFQLLRKYLPDEIGIKAGGGIGTVDEALAAHAAGCTRIGTTSTAAILDEWKVRLVPPTAPAAV
jgi:deoxyribose-phosphate aldolase